MGLQLMFCNTYHLMLQPGTEVVKRAGGLHSFMRREFPIITDSGGFQVFSLAYGSVENELKSSGAKKTDGLVIKINEDGVWFRSYRDGSKLLLTPESSVQAQKDLGADIIIPFDELPPYHISKEKLLDSFNRTHRWEERSLKSHLENPQGQAMYAVVHGGVDEELRKRSCDTLSALPFDGYAIGGSVGKTKNELYHLLSYTTDRLDPLKPNHLLGIGDLESINHSVPLGVDTFDSSYPTRAARHEVLFSEEGPIKITRGEYKENFGSPVKGCQCPTCKSCSGAYLHHLFKAKELTAFSLATQHNIYYMVKLMERYREAILNGSL